MTLGQKVFAGDVLAELSIDSIEEELEESRKLVAQLEEEASYYEGLLSIEKERESLAKRYGKSYDEDKLKKATNAYEECAGRKYVAPGTTVVSMPAKNTSPSIPRRPAS